MQWNLREQRPKSALIWNRYDIALMECPDTVILFFAAIRRNYEAVRIPLGNPDIELSVSLADDD